jgi:YaiO family outer membrane protein
MGQDGEERFFVGGSKIMKRLVWIFFVVCLSFYINQGEITAHELSTKEKALQALKGQDYTAAITICLDRLASEPDNYDFNFILVRAYAYSGQRDKALELLDKMLDTYPENTDLLLFRSRVQSWSRDFTEAESGYEKVLEADPENIEALTGLAEITSWKNEYGGAIQKYQGILLINPDNADIYFRIGRVYQWEGNYQKAKENYQRAVQIDPEDENFRQALKNAHPIFNKNYELRYQYMNEGFSDERQNYIDHFLYFSIRVAPDIGTLQLKYNQTNRLTQRDVQYGFEFYPHLWQKAYGYFDFSYSPKAVHFPRTSYLFEVYQALPPSVEVSVGYRRMNFEDKGVSIYLGSVGYYVGNYYPSLRWYYAPEDIGAGFSWIANIRRYFSDDSYVALGYGQGSRPFEIVTIEDISVTKSWIFLAEWDWYFLRSIRLKFQYMHRSEEDGPARNSIFVATGYRW